jgi:hypothetical protein
VTSDSPELLKDGQELNLGQQQQQHEMQQQRDVQALRAALLDSLACHSIVTHSSSQGVGQLAGSTAARLQQQQQQQELEQLTLACMISSIHATILDRDSSTTAAAAAASTQRSSQPASPAAVLKCLQQLVANGIAIKPFLSSSPEDRWGLGLYPVTAAVVNHDCDPNCSIRYAVQV